MNFFKDDKPNWLTVTFNLESGFANWISRLFTSEGNYKMMGMLPSYLNFVTDEYALLIIEANGAEGQPFMILAEYQGIHYNYYHRS